MKLKIEARVACDHLGCLRSRVFEVRRTTEPVWGENLMAETSRPFGVCDLDCAICGDSAVGAAIVEALDGSTVPTVRRLLPLCWRHKRERQHANGTFYPEIVRCEQEGVGRLDRGRVGGGVTCETCGRLYYDHSKCRDHPYLTVLCDGSVVKL